MYVYVRRIIVNMLHTCKYVLYLLRHVHFSCAAVPDAVLPQLLRECRRGTILYSPLFFLLLARRVGQEYCSVTFNVLFPRIPWLIWCGWCHFINISWPVFRRTRWIIDRVHNYIQTFSRSVPIKFALLNVAFLKEEQFCTYDECRIRNTSSFSQSFPLWDEPQYSQISLLI